MGRVGRVDAGGGENYRQIAPSRTRSWSDIALDLAIASAHNINNMSAHTLPEPIPRRQRRSPVRALLLPPRKATICLVEPPLSQQQHFPDILRWMEGAWRRFAKTRHAQFPGAPTGGGQAEIL